MTSFGWTRKSGNFGVNSAFQEENVRLQILEILCLSKVWILILYEVTSVQMNLASDQLNTFVLTF